MKGTEKEGLSKVSPLTVFDYEEQRRELVVSLSKSHNTQHIHQLEIALISVLRAIELETKKTINQLLKTHIQTKI